MVRASSRAWSRSVMKAPEPTLTSRTSALGAFGDLLAHDRAGDEGDRLDRAGHVPQGVELAVGGSQALARRADHPADVAQLRRAARRCAATSATPGSTRACRACRRCAPGRGRTPAARQRRRRPRAARAPGWSCRPPRPSSACRRSGTRASAKSMRAPEATIAAVSRAISRSVIPLSRIAIASADICSSATSPRVKASMTQSICASLSSAPSRLATMTSTASKGSGAQAGHRARSRGPEGRSGPKASGSSAHRSGGRHDRAGRGPPCSQSSWRQRPHGSSGSAPGPAHDTATSRPPPLACSAETSPHSAHRVRPYDAFSTLQPATTRPSSTSPAAPTAE